MHPHPHQPGLILPSLWNVRQKAAVATLCTLCKPPSAAQRRGSFNPNPDDSVANMTSKTQNCCEKFIIHEKIVKKILHKGLVFNFVKASFYQNDDFVLGFCANAFRAACIIEFQPLVLKSDRKEGGFWGMKFKI